ncbi:DEAD/DEAH box helicase [Heliobacterium chlorum]|uniref:DNA 3'-5' helicase n=1 Tax=Heliobacterium chlorum TaxID=2698 RepID=A0ABR7T5Q8_HELCL|nr:DNA repair helicase XPB [Heliobacterium chlorum]MBC9785348.1 DEAD/DEAH box helicase [Heliobacterium chlorum]
MSYQPSNPIIVQGDFSLLLEVDNPLFQSARDEVAQFSDLEKSPEHIHTYRLSPLSLWNAAASGLTAEHILTALEKYSKFDLPQNVRQEIEDQVQRFGRIKLIQEDCGLFLVSDDPYAIQEIASHKKLQSYFRGPVEGQRIPVNPMMRGHVKQALIKLGFPVEDLAGYEQGTTCPMSLRSVTSQGQALALRDYQQMAADAFYAGGSNRGGSGVIVLPCGAGKTVTAMALMGQLQTETLIITTNITALRQWRQELLAKTTLTEDQIGEYSGEIKEIRPVTITTYQILAYRQDKSSHFPHLEIFTKKNWGFIVYDEVHLLPAPVFRVTAEIQAKRRLGLTATLIREDGLEEDVFSLIGPKKFDVPWKELEKKGWIASAHCIEVRVPMPGPMRLPYAVADSRAKFRIASENPEKEAVVHRLLQRHPDDQVLIFGQYIDQLESIAAVLGIPVITGKTPNQERIRLYDAFKSGSQKRLVLSKVANFAIDLPDANVAIQVSGTFGSRQEEAQRLGRVLRPKVGDNRAYFYSLVTANSRDQDFAANRQLFLTEQGYKYSIVRPEELND